MRPYLLTIGQKDQPPRISREVMAPDAFTAHERHVCLAESGERVEVKPLPTEEDFERADVQHAMHKADRYHLENDRRAVEGQVAHFCARGWM